MNELNKISWNCPECNSLLKVRQSTNYFSCHICGSAFKLRWRSGKINEFIPLKNIRNVLEDSGGAEELQVSLDEKKIELQGLNNRIRRIEMSKSGERIRVFSMFIIICTAIYALFRYSVDGLRTLEETTMTDLSIGAAAALAFLLLISFSIYRNAVVRRVNKLYTQREELELQVNKEEASLHLYSNSEAVMQASEAMQEDESVVEPAVEQVNQSTEGSEELNEDQPKNIIKDYAEKIKAKRKRISLREEE
jgi:predicted RNA-binding Zn-ribbon protein involved in translation (DUF1610 family)